MNAVLSLNSCNCASADTVTVGAASATGRCVCVEGYNPQPPPPGFPGVVPPPGGYTFAPVGSWLRRAVIIPLMWVRQAVDMILIKCVPMQVVLSISEALISSDFLSFCLFAFTCFRVPSGLSMFVHVLW